jgi:hypothetical protein
MLEKLIRGHHAPRCLLAAQPRRLKRPKNWTSPIEEEWPLEIAQPLPWSCVPEDPPPRPVGLGGPLRRYPV